MKGNYSHKWGLFQKGVDWAGVGARVGVGLGAGVGLGERLKIKTRTRAKTKTKAEAKAETEAAAEAEAGTKIQRATADYFIAAISEISTCAPSGRSFTATV